MFSLVLPITLPLALLGHLALWIWLFNRLHATGVPRTAVKLQEKAILLCMAVIPLLWLPACAGTTPSATGNLAGGYLLVCCLAAGYAIIQWTVRKLRQNKPAPLVSNDTTLVDVAAELTQPLAGNWSTSLLARLPGNQMFQLAIDEKVIRLPQLPSELDGLAIVHLSDFHLAGHVRPAYFHYVVDRANELDGDLIALTGDLVDAASCLDWIPEVFGRLRARAGVYFVLGNHDKRLRDIVGLRRRLGEVGVADLGGRCRHIQLAGQPVLLAGNERPWFGRDSDLQRQLQAAASRPAALRVLLAHTPDRIGWARRHGFDLLLAGHTHGGQIRLPLIGPVVSPSYHGVRYAGGVFWQEPTLMHVSRGISSLQAVRFNCPPELTRLVIRSC